jgi:hypothetical protein
MQSRPVRYEIQRPVEFRVRIGAKMVQGSGRTANISRNGILFKTDEALRVGDKIDCVIAMGPGLIDAQETVNLQVQGITLRNNDGSVAVVIKKHRIRPTHSGLDDGLGL